MQTDPFTQIAAVLALAVVVGFIATRLKQPLILAFIVVGIAVGPSGLGWVSGGGESEIELFSELGIAVLLFLVGIKLDLALVRAIGPVAVATGLGQMAFTFGAGLLLVMAMGFDTVTSAYVALALTFSSTIIVVKLLSDKREIDQLHGRIAVGMLIVQDVAVIVAMIAVTAIAAGGDGGWSIGIASVLAKGAGFMLAIAICMKWVLPAVLPRIAASRELLVIFSIAWAVAVSAAGHQLDLSKEVGAFVAGFALASTPYREAIGSRLVSLRDFLLLFFFIRLGSQIELRELGRGALYAALLSVFVLVGKPLVMMVILKQMHYRTKVSFPAGVTIAQISEFSLIFVTLGVSVGHVGSDALGLVTLVGVITIGISTYWILHWQSIYERIGTSLGAFEPRSPRALKEEGGPEFDVIVLGAGRYGRVLTEHLASTGASILVVDWDPLALSTCKVPGIRTLYGDAEDPEFIASLPLHAVRWIMSTLPSFALSAAVVTGLEAAGYSGGLALTAHTPDEARRLGELVPSAEILSPFEHGVAPAIQLVQQD